MAQKVEPQWRGWILLIMGLALGFLFFYMMLPFLVPIFLGAVFAILCYPVYDRCSKYTPRHVAALIVTLGTMIGVLLPLVFSIYNGSYHVLNWIRTLKLPGEDSFETWMNHPWVNSFMTTVSRFTPIDAAWMKAQLLSILENSAEKVYSLITGFVTGMPAFLLAFTVTMISIYFFMVDGPRFLRFLSSLSPLQKERSEDLFLTFQRSCRGVVLGLFASALVQAVLMIIFFWVTGVPAALLMGVLTLVMGMVPLIGSAPIWIGAIVYLFSSGFVGKGIVMIVGGILISTVDNVIRPVIMKGQSEMHPLLALVSVFGAVNLIGATGIFVGPIVAAVFISFLKIVAQEILRENSSEVLTLRDK